MFRPVLHFLVILLAGLTALHSADKGLMSAPGKGSVEGPLPAVPPTPPEQAAAKFRVLHGFRMDLLASEPQVASPVAMTYDENGRAYVCEMRDYPYTDKANHKPGQENPTDQPIGRVRLLEDLDGDGVFDRSVVFADGLSWPTGIACWKGGVFVAATPDVWYLKDTDGDGRADERRKVFSGFKKLNVQAVMNNLAWGLDNRIHGAGGSNGGRIIADAGPAEPPVTLARADFRFDAREPRLELMSGGARFGGSFDDWGNRFLCNIRNPAQHVVLPSRYLARNRWLVAPSAVHDMAESGDQLPVHPLSPPEPWRVIRARRWAGERDILMPRSELVGAGVVTSASGVTGYRGAAYPKEFQDNVFVCECAGNLLYRLKLTPDGVTFKAARVDGDAEIVASTDNWFRPVNFVNAPDGTLHILDMYRGNIEHPWSIPEDIHAAVDLEAGRDMGRIWRLSPPGFKPARAPKLGNAASADLVAELENPNSWWRETAQRLLFERQDAGAVPALRQLVRHGRLPQARLHALWTLQGLGALADEDLLAALKDASAGVRENAVRLAEARPGLFEAILPLAEDREVRVRFQTAFTLGEFKDERAVEGLASMARRDHADPWMRTAILSSAAETSDRLLSKLTAGVDASLQASDLIRELSQIVGSRGRQAEIQQVLSTLSAGGSQGPAAGLVVSGIGAGLKRGGTSIRSAGLTGAAATWVGEILDRAVRAALDPGRGVEERLAAVQLLTLDDFKTAAGTLARLMEASEPQDIQAAAIRALGGFTTPEAVPMLLAGWKNQTPAVRAEVVTAMLGVRTRALPLMRAVESGLIPASQIPFASRRLLGLSSDAEVRRLAEKHFSSSAPGPRREVIAKYAAALERKGDAARGRKVFETACIACHRAGGLGVQDIGPNLANIRAWNPEQVLINILDPNREVVPSFLAYTVETRSGGTVYGVIAEEGASGLTIKRPDGVSQAVLRQDIARITGSGLSLMPEGLEAIIPPEGMADLIAFLLAAPAGP